MVPTRSLAAVLSLPLMFGMFVLLMADRAPVYTVRQLTRLRVLADRLETVLGADLLDRSDIPLSFEQAGHLALWSMAGFVASMLAGGSVRDRHVLAALLSVSVASELAQSAFTSARSAEWSDLAANAIGAAFGVGVVALGRHALGHSGEKLTPGE